ncbi:hypothetical protein IQ243_04250 [Nostocales cyanobacterium LEGE 11386]|nr:hypothetical protein [Nostocales cyanobacterium LEGE 11386]
MSMLSMYKSHENNAFKEAVKLRNEASSILWDSLERAYPFSAPADENRDSFHVPVLGIRQSSEQDYQIAVHIAEERDRKIIAPIFSKIPEERIDIQVTGPVLPYGCQVCFGAAISHCDPIAAQQFVGTLGCFVKKRGHSDLFILSNNHVLANLNKGQRGKDAVFLHELATQEEYQADREFRQTNSLFQTNKFLQKLLSLLPPRFLTFPASDQATFKGETKNTINDIGILIDFIDLKANSTNLVDAAIAKINDLSLVKLNEIQGVGQLKGHHNKDHINKVSKDLQFTKIGRRTGQTWGKIVLMNADLSLNYDENLLGCRFPDIIAFEGIGNKPFSLKGDSGSLIIDENGYALALLIAGTLKGGKNGLGITYGIPISTVLSEMDVDLVLDNGMPQIF